MNNAKKTILIMGSLLLLSGLVAACNTVEGAGQDLQAGGKAIATAANNAK